MRSLSYDKIVKIFIDSNGKKHYKVEDYIHKFFVKFDDWKNCNQITDKVDAVVEISGKEKANVTKKVREKLNQIKNV